MSGFPRFSFRVVGVAWACAFAPSAGAAVPVRIVAITGQEAVGAVPTGKGTYVDVSYVAVDALGRATFATGLAGDGFDNTNDRAIYSEGNGTLFLWAQEGTDAPGTGAGVKFNTFDGLPVMNREGKITFTATLTGNGVGNDNHQGIWSNAGGLLNLVARTGDIAPGAPPGAKFLLFVPPVLNAAGQMAFEAVIAGGRGIWTDRSGNLAPIVVTGSHAPGFPDGVTLDELSAPAMNDSGQTAFTARLTGPGINDANNVVLYSEGGGTLSPLARTGTQAPGTLLGVNFSLIVDTPTINSAGRCAFVARIAGTLVFENVNDLGIWSNAGGSVELVARTGVPAPDTGLGVVFDNFTLGPVTNSSGRVAFVALVRGLGVTPNQNAAGIWSQGGGNLGLVARAGSQAPGMPDGVVFDRFIDIAINNAGRVAFYASTRSATQPFVNVGIWAQRDSGLTLIAAGGDQITISPNDVRTIESAFMIAGSAHEDGRSAGFNNDGDIAFGARFIDGSSGVFSTKLQLPDRSCGTCGVGASASMAMALPLLLAARCVRRARPGRRSPFTRTRP